MPRPCKWCDSIEHTQFYCPRKRRKPIAVRKRPKQIGKYGKQWIITRETWFRKNPPEYMDAYYKCYLNISDKCPGYMPPERTTLDHIKSRSRHPELRYTMSNLAPSCYPCNRMKGSKDLEDL